MKDVLYAPLLISDDPTKTNHPWVTFRGSIYVNFQETMMRKLPKVFTNVEPTHILVHALGNHHMETQL